MLALEIHDGRGFAEPTLIFHKRKFPGSAARARGNRNSNDACDRKCTEIRDGAQCAKISEV